MYQYCICLKTLLWEKHVTNFLFSLQAIYDMLGTNSASRPADSAEERAKAIFSKMDENNDGNLTQEEFLKGCLLDEELSKMLTPGA